MKKQMRNILFMALAINFVLVASVNARPLTSEQLINCPSTSAEILCLNWVINTWNSSPATQIGYNENAGVLYFSYFQSGIFHYEFYDCTGLILQSCNTFDVPCQIEYILLLNNSLLIYQDNSGAPLVSCDPQNCIDPDLITGLNCPGNFDPVCGCDGNTYSNACNAQEAGVSSWVNGECGTLNTVCGNTTIIACSGLISDGSGSGNYVNNLKCSWLISPINAAVVTLNFSSFSTEATHDVVTIHDGVDGDAPLLGTFSGNLLPPQITATSGSMYIEFNTDASVTGQGWSAFFSCVQTGGTPPVLTQFSNSSLSIEYEEAILSSTVSSQSIVVWGNLTGRREGNYSTAGNVVNFVPAEPFLPGEEIHITSTSTVASLSGNLMLAHNWVRRGGVTNITEAQFYARSTGIVLPPLAAGQPLSLVTADLNQSGFQDIIVLYDSSDSTHVWVYTQQADSTFVNSFSYSSSNALGLLHGTPDLNNDGLPDILITYFSPSAVEILLNNGDGTFSSQGEYPASSSASYLSWGDFDKDGYLDLAILSASAVLAQNAVTILRNQGDGSFEADQLLPIASTGSSIRLADTDMDGDIDIFVTTSSENGGTPEFIIFENDGSGNFSQASAEQNPESRTLSENFYDLDGNGTLDMISSTLEVQIHLDNEELNYSLLNQELIRDFGFDFTAVRAGDLSGNGQIDILVPSAVDAGSYVEFDHVVFRNSGASNFDEQQGTIQMGRWQSAHFSDMDGDGDLDLVYVLQNGEIFIADNGVAPATDTTLVFVLNSTDGPPGTIAQVPVSVLGFESMVGFSFTIELTDTNVGVIVGLENAALEVDEVLFNSSNIGVAWNNPGGSGNSLDLNDEEIIFYVLIELSDSSAVCSDIRIIDGLIPFSALNAGVSGPSEVPALTEDAEVCTLADVLKAGQILTQTGMPVQDVEVICNNTLSVFTDAQGNYQFDPLPPGQDYSIFPVKDTNYRNGIDLMDYILIRDHFLGVQPIASPYTLIAADVNDDCVIDETDEQLVKALFFYQIDEWVDVPSWRFVPSSFVFDDPLGGCDTPEFPESIELEYLIQDAYDQDFVGIKMGDITLNASGSMFQDEDVQYLNQRIVQLNYSTPSSLGSSSVLIPFYLGEESIYIRGFSMELSINLSQWSAVRIISGALPGQPDISESAPIKDRVLIAWTHPDGTFCSSEDSPSNVPLFYLELKPLSTQVTTPELQLSELLFQNTMYDASLQAHSIELKEILETPDMSVQGASNQGIQLLSNRPNPFSDFTQVSLWLNEPGDVQISVFDLAGRILFHSEEQLMAGYQEIRLEGHLFGYEGLYFCRVSKGFENQVIPIIFSNN